ncbi:S8 family serine peptidase [Hydrogenimonas sp.]
MKGCFRALGTICILCAMGHSVFAAQNQSDYAPNEAIVVYKDESALRSAYALLPLHVLNIDLLKRLSDRSDKIFAKIRSSLSAETLCKKLRQDPRVIAVSPNYRRHLYSVPDDPDFQKQWGLHNTGQFIKKGRGSPGADIHIENAWNLTTGSVDVVVAILDTGIDYRHSDLRNNIWINTEEMTGVEGIDDDGNGYIDDIYGYDFAAQTNGDNDPDPMDADGHGTNVAGIVGAVGNNGTGISGVNWHIKMMAVKVLRPDGYIYDSDILEGIEYILAMKEKMVDLVAVNASFGNRSGNQNDPLHLAIEELGRAGILFCAAAGNSHRNNDGFFAEFPASYDAENIIAVTATDQNDSLASFSNYGKERVDIAAPGVDILSTLPNESYGFMSGTSEATPFVTGTVGLIASLYPDENATIRKARILKKADTLENLENYTATSGRLNAAAALQADAAKVEISIPASLQGVCEGTGFTLKGKGFGHQRGSVEFIDAKGNSTHAVILSWSDTRIDASAPSMESGKNVFVEDAYGLRSETITATAWRSANEPVFVHPYGFAVTNNREIYLGGGLDSDILERYDIEKNEWDQISMLPEARSGSTAVLRHDSIYIFGGHDDNDANSDKLYIYDITTSQWKEGTPLPLPLRHAKAALIGENIYLSGGMRSSESGSETDALYRYDPDADRWETLAPMHERRAAHAMISYRGELYVFGGFSNGVPLRSIERYDPETNRWGKMAQMPMPLAFMDAAQGYDMKGKPTIFIAGGKKAMGERCSDEIFLFDPGQERWSKRSDSLYAPLRTHCAASTVYVPGKGFYLVAGLTDRNIPTKKMEYLFLPFPDENEEENFSKPLYSAPTHGSAPLVDIFFLLVSLTGFIFIGWRWGEFGERRPS